MPAYNKPTQPCPSKIAAIIPAYNEAGKIGKVLEVVFQVGSIDEIIVVDDGSKDSTSKEVEMLISPDSCLRLIRNPVNLGKGQSILNGWKSTSARYLLLLDADLLAISPAQIEMLMEPVVKGKYDMTVGIFRGGKPNTDFAHWATPWLSGQRCLRSELLNQLSPEAASGYGLETALTVAGKIYDWRVEYIVLRGVYHLPSEFHRGIGRGILTRARMYRQIVKAWYVAGGPETLRFRRWKNKTSFHRE